MNILFVHQNFPGQFRHLAPAMQKAGQNVRALAIQGAGLPDIPVIRHTPQYSGSSNIHPFASDIETKLIRGESCAIAAVKMRQEGYVPDLIIGHPGWGEMLFLKEIWPTARQLHFMEFFYSVQNSDSSFDMEFQSVDWSSQARIRAKNACSLLSLDIMDAGYSPMEWQRSSFPSYIRDKIQLVHDGVDTDQLTPNINSKLRLGFNGPEISHGREVVTFVNRNLEPYRGYHIFMRALPKMQKLRPNAIFVLIGADGVSYGPKPNDGKSWKEIFLDEVRDQIDLSRVFFPGQIPYRQFITLMQISAAHVYLSYPFVLSWSMLEAMSCGALIIGSNTPPVTEVIEHGHNGLLVDFFDIDGLADQVTDALSNPGRYQKLRSTARDTVVSRYDLHRICLPKQIKMAIELATGI